MTDVKEFPDFMRRPANRIGKESQFTEGTEGYVFTGADGSWGWTGMLYPERHAAFRQSCRGNAHHTLLWRKTGVNAAENGAFP
jgi:hypothetical protein